MGSRCWFRQGALNLSVVVHALSADTRVFCSGGDVRKGRLEFRGRALAHTSYFMMMRVLFLNEGIKLVFVRWKVEEERLSFSRRKRGVLMLLR